MSRPRRSVVAAVLGTAVLAGCGASPLTPVVATRSSSPTSPSTTTGSPATTASAPAASSTTPGASSTSTATATASLDPVSPLVPSDVPTGPDGSGPIPVLHKVDTKDPVVFITIDDGYTKDPAVVALLKARDVPVTPFLTVDAVKDNPAYYSAVKAATGQTPQDHSVTHPFLKGKSLEAQKKEICGAADSYQKWFGTRPWMFRPPYGSYDQTTQSAAAQCGMSYVVLWDVSLPHAVLRYASGSTLHAGDIILIHWRPKLAADLPVALDAIASAGLRVGALQDYLLKP